MKRWVVLGLVALFTASAARAEVTLLEGKQFEAKKQARKSTGATNLVDITGLKYFINWDITFFTTSSASGAASEASYVSAVQATTIAGGLASSTLNDAFDGYGALWVNGTVYNNNGAGVMEENGRQIDLNEQMIGNLAVTRKVFVPENDAFIRWLNIVENQGSTSETVLVSIENNLGSDSNTRITDTSDGDTNATITDTWVASMQNYSSTNVGATSSDPRLGHVLQGVGARVGLSFIKFVNGDDNPQFQYEFALEPGQKGIIVLYCTGQPTKFDAAAKADELASKGSPAQFDFMTPGEKQAVLNFSVAGVPNDFNGDGKSDFLVWDSGTAMWYARNPGVNVIEPYGFWFGFEGGVPVSGDFNGDGLCDVGVFDPAGVWYIVGEGGYIAWAQSWGYAGCTPVPADYDGDGKCDLAVYDASVGLWYVAKTDGSPIAWAESWGFPGTIPVPGDYDGDGKCDLAVYDSATAKWYIRTLAGAPILWDAWFGFPGAVPVPGDYDGDGKCDLAVFDPATALWYIVKVDGTPLAWARLFGYPGVIPVPSKYSGTATDLAVYDPVTSKWYVETFAGVPLVWDDWFGTPATRPVIAR